jgi:hypothetical protein
MKGVSRCGRALNGQMVPRIGQMISSPAIIEFYAQLVEVHDPFALLSHENYARESSLDSRQGEASCQPRRSNPYHL